MTTEQIIAAINLGNRWAGIIKGDDWAVIAKACGESGMEIREMPGQVNEVNPYVVIERVK